MVDVSWLGNRYEGKPIIRVWEEWSSSGLWNPPTLTSVAVGPHERFNDLPADFERDLAEWQDRFDAGIPELPRADGFWETFWADRLNLTIRLSLIVGEQAYVQCEAGDRMLVFLNGACVRLLPTDEGPQ